MIRYNISLIYYNEAISMEKTDHAKMKMSESPGFLPFQSKLPVSETVVRFPEYFPYVF